MVLRHPQTRAYQSDRASRTACRTATHPADHTPRNPTRESEKFMPSPLTNVSPYQLALGAAVFAPEVSRRSEVVIDAGKPGASRCARESDRGRGRLTTIWIVAITSTITVRMRSLRGISSKMAYVWIDTARAWAASARAIADHPVTSRRSSRPGCGRQAA